MPERTRRQRGAAAGGEGAVPLSSLAVGRVARLHRRDLSEGESCLLTAMGIGDGCRLVVRVVGDPCIVEVRTTRIGLARSVANRIWVVADGVEVR